MSDSTTTPAGSTKGGRAFMFIGLGLGLLLAGGYYFAATRRLT